jgi:menaquinone-9 beta-reductase
MTDVIVVGAGPAGALAATILARHGVRVTVFDRARFPRPKLCGDTLNPGALAVLATHVSLEPIVTAGLPLAGMRVTGPGGVHVDGRYRGAQRGQSIARADLDLYLLQQARAAGAIVEEGAAVDAPIVSDDGVEGVHVRETGGTTRACLARLVIAADGRESKLTRALKLAAFARQPRRWAVGAYFEGVTGLIDLGEMHVRHGCYIGVAPVPGGLANTCLVVPHGEAARRRDPPADARSSALAADAVLAPRFASARMMGKPVVLGPMAVDAPRAGVPGLLLAGDAAGFIDPMTGDGLRLALHGAVLAAETALEVLNGTVPLRAAADRLSRRRHAAFASKWRFNRALRQLVASPAAVTATARVARVLPLIFEPVIRYAGDCDVRGQGRDRFF